MKFAFYVSVGYEYRRFPFAGLDRVSKTWVMAWNLAGMRIRHAHADAGEDLKFTTGMLAMDVKFFLKERTDFVSYFYESSSAPFSETMRKIRDKEAPFEEPPYDERMGTEPAFLEEYLQAGLGIEVVGQTCITLLSESLNLYFKSLARELRVDCEKVCSRSAFNKGFIHGYKACFALRGVDWSACPVRFDVLEQVVLARNDSRHTLHLTNLRVQHSDDTLRKYANPLFVSEYEKELVEKMGGTWLLNPTIHLTQPLLEQAIEEITKLAEWLEERLFGSESGQ